MQDLNVTLVQRPLAWESPEDNRRQIAKSIAEHAAQSDLIVLPEMFTTGFSMNALANAEAPGGATEQWMQALAQQYDCAITGSVAIAPVTEAEQTTVYNRMLFVTPDNCHHYDKRHLFRMAGEHKRYGEGKERVVVAWRGWRILLQVCYDLRFPVFARNQGDYDMALFVANWPDTRALHWRSLLVGRAIENQACVVGVNRIGNDANNLSYSGDSLAVKADGTLAIDMAGAEDVRTATFSGEELAEYRKRFPFAADADDFRLM
ncbi:carbon-nitrogen hydrolase [Halioglobus sp. HI00S01]|uniref:amidohydrolase n=1 Tax=Halioglobus sp. HI00S01 TaxID=1822214 RepID=UPI0007C2D05D|nr:amidohydrolase [Halioglobus sp. HI00S01]KZX59598.1 carbon-nitrogen hydrolase [Halioglobus sp. HI00S01]